MKAQRRITTNSPNTMNVDVTTSLNLCLFLLGVMSVIERVT